MTTKERRRILDRRGIWGPQKLIQTLSRELEETGDYNDALIAAVRRYFEAETEFGGGSQETQVSKLDLMQLIQSGRVS